MYITCRDCIICGARSSFEKEACPLGETSNSQLLAAAEMLQHSTAMYGFCYNGDGGFLDMVQINSKCIEL